MTRRAPTLWHIAVAVTVAVAVAPDAARSEDVTIYAAASLTNAVMEVAGICAEDDSVKTSFASSSVLAKQIAYGAPAQVYISASSAWMDYLDERGLLEANTRRHLIGNDLVAIVGGESNVEDGTPVDAAIELIGGGDRIAMGDPDHVPAGMYAKAALKELGLWSKVANRAARTATVRAALALVETDATPLGFVYRTDALVSQRVRIISTFPAFSHLPIVYEVAVVRGASTPTVRRFRACLEGAEATAVFERFGFASLTDVADADAR